MLMSKEESLTMVVRISRGRQFMIKMPMLIFTDANNTYLINGLEDDILGVTYRIGKKSWMDQHLFFEYIPTRCT